MFIDSYIVLQNTLERVRGHWYSVENGFLEEAKVLKDKGSIIHLAVNRTMMPFNYAVEDNILAINRAIVLPTTYLSIEVRNKFFDSVNSNSAL